LTFDFVPPCGVAKIVALMGVGEETSWVRRV
jgi:hypothetical protein